MKDMMQLPGLLKQEKEALGTQAILLYKIYHCTTNQTEKRKALERLLEYILTNKQFIIMKNLI